jgi:hypothetical protein
MDYELYHDESLEGGYIYQQGYARMKNSRRFNSFVIGQCYLENYQWKFEGVRRNHNDGEQLEMPHS